MSFMYTDSTSWKKTEVMSNTHCKKNTAESGTTIIARVHCTVPGMTHSEFEVFINTRSYAAIFISRLKVGF